MAKLKDLKPNEKNPRKISDEKLKQLKRAIKEFGDLSGIVFNKKSKRLVGAHQRVKIFPPDATVHITKQYKTPTPVGTTAEGFVRIAGERHTYREVSWSDAKEKAANLAANRNAGEWDLVLVSEFMRDIDAAGIDLGLTMFNLEETQELMIPTLGPKFEEGGESDQGRLDSKTPIECPHCGEEFVPGSKTIKGDEEE